MHVITGRFKGQALTTPRSETRPTTDRTKEALFSTLESRGLLDDARILDLFAGTGALGIEALSRGGRSLVAVEASKEAAGLIAQTLTRLRQHHAWDDSMDAHVIRAKAERYTAKAKLDEPFDVVFIDPPYAFSTKNCEQLLTDLTARHMVSDDGVIILERSTRTAPPQAPQGWFIDDRRDYGETAVYTLRSEAYHRAISA